MPNPSGSTMTTKSLGSRPSDVARRSCGPMTPSTPTSDAAMPRYSSAHLILGGGADERDALAQLLDDGAHRLLGVVGDAGAGRGRCAWAGRPAASSRTRPR